MELLCSGIESDDDRGTCRDDSGLGTADALRSCRSCIAMTMMV